MEQNREVGVEEIKSFLSSELPVFMIPSNFFILDELPVTSNGKVDRNKLKDLETTSLEVSTEYVEPETDLEKQIAEVWKEVLGLERVGIHNSFFDLGGHSLLLLQLREKLNKVVEKEISVVDLFQYPNISAFAKFLEKQDAESEKLNSVNERSKLQRQALSKRRAVKRIRG